MGLANKFLNGTGLSRLVGKIKNYVKPNPTLAGTESALTGLEVDGTKYKVPEATTIGGVGGAITLGAGLSMTGSELAASGGGHLYQHTIVIKSPSSSPELGVTTTVIDSNATPYTNSTIENAFTIPALATGLFNPGSEAHLITRIISVGPVLYETMQEMEINVIPLTDTHPSATATSTRNIINAYIGDTVVQLL